MRAPTVPPQLQRLAAQAARAPQGGFTPLAPLSDADVLRDAYRHTSQSRAAGSDGVMAQRSAEPLDEHRRDVQERLRSGRYPAAPVERVWIEQDAGGQRLLGQPTCEDTRVQRAVALLLEAIDEPDCYDGSEGVRQGRSPHAARHERRPQGMPEGMGWSVEAEGSGDVDSRDSTHRREVRRQRGRDGRMLRLIGKWRRAGVREDGALTHPEPGVVPGGVRAPVLAYLFLHPVLEAGFEREGQPRRKGRGVLRRCAEDCVSGCALAVDAHKMMAVRPQRFARCGLTRHPTKTALVACRPPEAHPGADSGNGTCTWLGLTHDWTQSRQGCWVMKRRTARKRRRRTKQSLGRWGRSHRHAPLPYPYQMRCTQLRGHFPYDGMRGNCRLLEEGRRFAEQAWRYWWSRRRSKSAIGWGKCAKLMRTYIRPTPKIVHTI